MSASNNFITRPVLSTVCSLLIVIVGLIAILLELFDGQTPAYITETDAIDVMGRIGLDQHLSPNRRNGLVAMVERIKSFAAQAA